MSRDLFGTLMQLTVTQPWLVRRSRELFDTVAVCEDEDQKALVVDLISRFHFRSVQNYLDDLRKIATKIAEDWGCLPENTLIIALQDNACADSTSMVVQQLKGPLAEYGEWKTGNFITRLADAIERTQDGTQIVIVDDFCGSGGSISKKVIWLIEKLADAGKAAIIRVAVGSSMEQSKTAICPLVEDFFSVHWLQKGIRGYYLDQDQIDAIARMEAIEEKLAERSSGKKIETYKFGWMQSEALFYLEGGNPPNNNFPVFWWRKLKPSVNHTPLLPRV